MINNYVFQNRKKISEKSGMILCFAHGFNVWLNRRQWDCYICFSCNITLYVASEKLHLERMRVKKI